MNIFKRKEKTFNVKLTYTDANLIDGVMKHYPHIQEKVYFAKQKAFRNSTWTLFKAQVRNGKYIRALKTLTPWNIYLRNKASHESAVKIWNECDPRNT